MNNKSTILGLVLMIAYFLQYILKLEWSWLFELQAQEMYKRWTGLGLALFIIFQWVLTMTRTIKRFRKYAMSMLSIHKWLGAISPLIFYIHTASLGYGYLLLLTYIFFSNTLLGYLNLNVLKNNSDLLFKSWMIAHVALSVIVPIMMVFHITMVFYYK